nr:MAG TPA: hypothetical protein [Caudoviricetes sp.]
MSPLDHHPIYFFFYFLSMFLVNKITCHRSTFI